MTLASGALVLLLVAGCSVAPSETTARDTIERHFALQGYRVVSLEIGRIRKTPLSEVTYMGTEGFSVEIRAITLEAMEHRAASPKRRTGERITFSGGVIKIKERLGKKGEWIVGDVGFLEKRTPF